MQLLLLSNIFSKSQSCRASEPCRRMECLQLPEQPGWLIDIDVEGDSRCEVLSGVLQQLQHPILCKLARQAAQANVNQQQHAPFDGLEQAAVAAAAATGPSLLHAHAGCACTGTTCRCSSGCSSSCSSTKQSSRARTRHLLW
jgi:hypothetical protein